MTRPIPIYIGSDIGAGSKPAEVALEYSIRKHTDAAVDFNWMRAGEAPWDWGLEGGRQTHTSFTPFRFAIPYLCEAPRALYLDVDMIVLGDIAELWNQPQIKPWRCCPRQWYVPDGRKLPMPGKKDVLGAKLLAEGDLTVKGGRLKQKTEVSLIDCVALRQAKWYPSLKDMREFPGTASNYAKLLRDRGAIDETLPPEWNVLDDVKAVNGQPAKLIHYSDMGTQPWHPFPERFDYKRHHRCPDAAQKWWEVFKEAEDV